VKDGIGKMGLLEQSVDMLKRICAEEGVDLGEEVVVKALSPDEAIGDKAGSEFVLKRGKESVIEAVCLGARGQAFTDSPSSCKEVLRYVFDLSLDNSANRAITVAVMNAVLRALGKAQGTVHCRNEDPRRCGPIVAEAIEKRFGRLRVGLIGLQPAILSSLVDLFGASNVRLVDLNADNIGKEKNGVFVWDGEADLGRLIEECEVGLVTGSSIVSGTIDDITRRFGKTGKPVIFFGNTVSGAAVLLGLERICPFGQ